MKYRREGRAAGVVAVLLACWLQPVTGWAEEPPEAPPAAPEVDKAVDSADAAPKRNAQAGRERPPTGWKEVRRGGVITWCRKAMPTGSRVRSELECATPEQYWERMESDKAKVDELIRTAPGPRGN